MVKKTKGFKCKKCGREYSEKPDKCEDCGGMRFISALIVLGIVSDNVPDTDSDGGSDDGGGE